jgi:hypothetical protein
MMSRSIAVHRLVPPLLALGGPLAIGAILGMRSGAYATGADALSLPAVVFGVTLLMMPALYILASLLGAAPEAGEVAAATGAGLRACGTALLGLAGPAAFLAATADGAGIPKLTGAMVVIAGGLCGLRALYVGLFAGRGGQRAAVLFTCWSALVLALGSRLFVAVMA